MKKNITLFIIIFYLLSGLIVVQGQDETNKSGTTAAQFLKLGAGARAMGLAGSIVAHSDDVFSLYWNPAGISKVKGITLAGVYTKWFADIDHQFFGLVIPINSSSAVGFQAISVNMDPIEITTIDQPHGTSEFYDASDLAIGVSYAAWLTDFFTLGITGKYVQQKIYNESASTFAFDIGSMLNLPVYGMKLGMNFSNFGGKMQMDGRDLIREYDLNPNNTLNDGVEIRLKTEPWEIPVNFAVGVALNLLAPADGLQQSTTNRLTLSITGNHPTDAREYASFGLEYGLKESLFLRGGYRLNRDVEKFFYGVGLNIPLSGTEFRFDYSLASFEELDYIHIFSASISFQ